MTNQQHNKLFFYCFYLVIIAVGSGCLTAGIYEAHHSAVLYKTGLRTQGTVQKVEDRGNSDAEWTTYEVSFAAVDHQAYTIQNHYSVADKVKLYQVGQSVPVIYLSTDPEDGRIDNYRERTYVYAGCFLGALFAALFGILFYYFLHRPSLLSR